MKEMINQFLLGMPISQIYLSYYRYVIINFEHVVNFEKKEHNLH
jgi:hypothetical protein